jgi:hypothetical protein
MFIYGAALQPEGGTMCSNVLHFEICYESRSGVQGVRLDTL